MCVCVCVCVRVHVCVFAFSVETICKFSVPVRKKLRRIQIFFVVFEAHNVHYFAVVKLKKEKK